MISQHMMTVGLRKKLGEKAGALLCVSLRVELAGLWWMWCGGEIRR